MKSLKWYYIAIPAGLVLLYFMLKPSKTVSTRPAGSSGGIGGTLTGIAAASNGLSNLWDSVFNSNSSSSSSSSTSTDGEG